MEQFEHEQSRNEREIQDDELRALLIRLHRLDLDAEYNLDQHVTVDDVAEAMNASPEWVYDELIELRETLRREKIEKIMNELEEPLYRVERPSTEPTKDPIALTLRRRTVETILDKVVSDNVKRQRESRKANREAQKPTVIHTVHPVLMTLLVLALVALTITMIVSSR